MELTILPELPDSLTELRNYNNQLTNLPTIPSTLKNLFFNQIYYALIKERSRDVLALQQTHVKGYNCALNDDCLNILGSYLSGQSETLTMQIKRLRTTLI